MASPGTTTREEVVGVLVKVVEEDLESLLPKRMLSGGEESRASVMHVCDWVLEELFRMTRTGESDVEGRATQSMIPLIKLDISTGERRRKNVIYTLTKGDYECVRDTSAG